MRRSLLLLIKIAVTAALVGYLLWSADWATVGAYLRAARIELVMVAGLLQLTAFALQNLRWWLLLRKLQTSVPLGATVASFYLGLFGNNFMPSSVGGDIVRILHMRDREISGKVLLASVVVDRVLGLLGVVLIAAISFALLRPPFAPSWAPWLFVLLFVAIFGCLMLLLTPTADRLLLWCELRWHRMKVIGDLIQAIKNIRAYAGAWKTKLWALGLTLVLQVLVIISFFALAAAIGSELSLAVYFLAIPVVFLAASLPISLGGLGVREGTLVGILMLAGMDEQRAIGLGFLSLFVLLLLTLPGGFVLLATGRRRQQSRSSHQRGS